MSSSTSSSSREVISSPIPLERWNPEDFRLEENDRSKNLKHKIVSNQTGKELSLLLPFQKTFGIKDYQGDKNYKLTLFKLTPEFIDKMKTFEDALCEQAAEKSTELYKKRNTAEQMKDKMQGHFDEYKNETLYRMKVIYYKDTDKFDLEVLDMQQKFLLKGLDDESGSSPVSLIKSGSELVVVINFRGIYKIQKEWGYSVVAKQVMLKPVVSKKRQILIPTPLDDEESFVDDLSITIMSESEPESKARSSKRARQSDSSSIIEEEFDDEDNDEEDFKN